MAQKTTFTENDLKRLMRDGKPTKKNQPVSVGDKLYIAVEGVMTGTWYTRLTIHGKRTWREIAPFHAAQSLLEARIKHHEYLQSLAANIDPSVERKIKTGPEIHTWRELAESHFQIKDQSWKTERTRRDQRNRLEKYVYPIIGDLHPSRVTVALAERILEPIWNQRGIGEPVRFRCFKIWERGRVLGLCEGINPFTYADVLDSRFIKPKKIKVKHFPALPVSDLPTYYAGLRDGVRNDAFRWKILTATRSKEPVYTKWSEINLKDRTWTIPGERRLKNEEALVVPITSEMLEILMRQPRNGDLVFHVNGEPISEHFFRNEMVRLHEKKRRIDNIGWVDHAGDPATAHGFRSTFAQWAIRDNSVPQVIADSALGHIGSDRTAASYFRPAEIMDLRRKLMNRWCAYVTGKSVSTQQPQPAEVEL